MIILALAHARSSGDGSIIHRYVRSFWVPRISNVTTDTLCVQYNLFKKWADYLTTNTLIPGQQYVLTSVVLHPAD